MSDIATISLRVNTGEVVQANDELDKFGKAAVNTAKNVDVLSNAQNTQSKFTAKQIAEIDRIHQSVSKLRAETSETIKSTKAHSVSTKEQREELLKLLNQINPAAAALGRLDEMQDKLNRFKRNGSLDDETFLDAAVAIERARDKLGSAGKEMHQFSLKTAAARRQLSLMATQVMRGDFSAMGRSSITLANNSGLFGSLMSLKGLAIAAPITAATGAIYGLSKAYFAGAAEGEEFNKQLILTGGYAGKTVGQLSDMASSIGKSFGTTVTAASVLAKVVGDGSFKGDQLLAVASAANAMKEATGRSVESTIADFKRLNEDPLQGVITLDKQYHFLTASVYEQISALERQGDKAGAAKLAMDTLSGTMKTRADEIKNSLGIIELAWNGISNAAKSAWDYMLNVGRDISPDVTLAKVENKLKAQEITLRNSENTHNKQIQYAGKPHVVDRIRSDYERKRQDQLAAIEATKAELAKARERVKAEQDKVKAIEEGNLAAKKAIADDQEVRGIQQGIATSQQKFDKEKQKAQDLFNRGKLTEVEYSREVNRLTKQYLDNGKGGGSSGGQLSSELASARERFAILQQQSSALKEQGLYSSKINADERALIALDAKILTLKESGILTAQQKSNLVMLEQVRTQMSLNAALSKENDERQKGLLLIQQMNNYTDSIKSKAAQTLSKYGMGDREASRLDEQTQLKNTFERGGGEFDEQGGAIGAGAEAYKKAMDEQQVFYEAEDDLRGNWQLGFKAAWANFGDDASNTYGNIKNISENAFNGMSDTFTDFLTTGKADFKGFAVSVLTDITNMMVKMMMFKAIESGMGAMGYAGGGYTGDGGKFQEAGTVHRGEFVFHKEATQRIGVANLYRQMNGYADGGLVGSSSTFSAKAPAYGNQLSSITVNSPPLIINFQQPDGQSSTDDQQQGAGIAKMMQKVAFDAISSALRPGGAIWSATQSRR